MFIVRIWSQQVYELIAWLRLANQNGRNPIYLVQFLINIYTHTHTHIYLYLYISIYIYIYIYIGICNVNFVSVTGTIKCPNHPHNYPVNLKCVWVIDLGPAYNITLTSHKFIQEKRRLFIRLAGGEQRKLGRFANTYQSLWQYTAYRHHHRSISKDYIPGRR